MMAPKDKAGPNKLNSVRDDIKSVFLGMSIPIQISTSTDRLLIYEVKTRTGKPAAQVRDEVRGIPMATEYGETPKTLRNLSSVL